MQLALKRAWFSLKNFSYVDLNSEFQNIKNWWNYHDLGSIPWTRFFTQGSASFGVNTVSSAYTIGDLDYLVLANTTSAFTVTLPDATTIRGRDYIVMNTGTHLLTINTTSSQTINGNTSMTLPSQYFHAEFFSDGANWISL